MKQASGRNTRSRWQPAIALLAPGIMLIATLVTGGPAQDLPQTPTYTVLHAFLATDGGFPVGALIRDSSGNLYGTTLSGGNAFMGVIFKLSPSGTETVLHSFTGGKDGSSPYAGLIRHAAGNLYGTTAFGGGSSACPGGCGTIFKVNPSGTETILYRFTGGADGATPFAPLIEDPSGNLYGTTELGGAYGAGVVFKLSATGSETVLHSFAGYPTDGANSLAPLIRDAVGNLYGTASDGGPSGDGVVFQISPAGVETILHNFTGASGGGSPLYGGLLRDPGDNLYGTASVGGVAGCYGNGCGVVFRLRPGGGETVLYSFRGGLDGGNPYGGPIPDRAGDL